MRFYDLMTFVWAALWAALAGYFTFSLASSNHRAAWALAVIAAGGMVVAVICWRIYKDPR